MELWSKACDPADGTSASRHLSEDGARPSQCPEQLDRLLTVTTTRSWLALIAIAALILAALLWSIFGSISSYVEGQGRLSSRGRQLASASAPGTGTLSRLLVHKGDSVKNGQVVAEIDAPEVEQQIAGAQSLVAERKAS